MLLKGISRRRTALESARSEPMIILAEWRPSEVAEVFERMGFEKTATGQFVWLRTHRTGTIAGFSFDDLFMHAEFLKALLQGNGISKEEFERHATVEEQRHWFGRMRPKK